MREFNFLSAARPVFFALFFIMTYAVSGQFSIIEIEDDLHQRAADFAAANDNTYAVLTFSEPQGPATDLVVYKVEPTGFIVWETLITHENLDLNGSHKYPDIIALDDGGFAVLYTRQENTQPDVEFSMVVKLSANGVELWREEFECCFWDIIEADNGELWIAGTDNDNHDFLFRKLDNSGSELSSQTYYFNETGFNAPEEGFHLSINAQDEIVLGGVRNLNFSDVIHIRIDQQGNYLSGLEFGFATGTDVFSLSANSPDGGTFYLVSYDTLEDVYYYAKVNENGALEWENLIDAGGGSRRYFDMLEWNGGAVAVGHYRPDNGTTIDGLITFFDGDGNVISDTRVIIDETIEQLVGVIPSHDGGLQFLGRLFDTTMEPSSINPYLFGADAFGNLFSSKIIGQAVHDLNENCMVDGGEPISPGHFFNLANTGIYTSSFQDGTYAFGVDPGNFEVVVQGLSHYWGFCNDTIPVVVGSNEVVEVDFLVSPLVDCPLLEIQHGSGPMRICRDIDYNFQYCNIGTTTGEQVYVELELDPNLSIIDASIPYSGPANGVYTFQLPDVEVYECGSFELTAFLDCDTEIAEAICTIAQIYPDSICLENELWSGASIALTAECDGTNVNFELENVGTAPSGPINYIIIEDQVVLNYGQTQLNPLETEPVQIPANGSTITMIAEQEPYHPGFSNPMASVENCDGMGSPGYLTMFPPDDADYSIDIYCREALNSFDPNKKVAFPKGIGDLHEIESDTDIEYTLFFQNTGNDVAYHVRLEDSLSSYLDPGSIRTGASSHDYSWTVSGEGVLKFFFENINLPDSTSNEAESQGWVTYRISQKSDLSPGTVIENTAAIYFDFNPPIITNTVFHTIAEDLLVSVSPITPDEGISFDVFPNPVGRSATLTLESNTVISGKLSLYNVMGERIKSTIVNSQIIRFDLPGNLTAGSYFLQLLGQDGAMWVGKVLVF